MWTEALKSLIAGLIPVSVMIMAVGMWVNVLHASVYPWNAVIALTPFILLFAILVGHFRRNRN